MAMSRTVAALVVLLLPPAALAEDMAGNPISADQAMARYQTVTSLVAARCRQPGSAGEDIVVCGRAGPHPRLPLPADNLRDRLARDGVRTGTDALARTAEPIPLCSDPEAGYHCQGGLDFFAIGPFLYKMGGTAIHPAN